MTTLFGPFTPVLPHSLMSVVAEVQIEGKFSTSPEGRGVGWTTGVESFQGPLLLYVRWRVLLRFIT